MLVLMPEVQRRVFIARICWLYYLLVQIPTDERRVSKENIRRAHVGRAGGERLRPRPHALQPAVAAVEPRREGRPRMHRAPVVEQQHVAGPQPDSYGGRLDRRLQAAHRIRSRSGAAPVSVTKHGSRAKATVPEDVLQTQSKLCNPTNACLPSLVSAGLYLTVWLFEPDQALRPRA